DRARAVPEMVGRAGSRGGRDHRRRVRHLAHQAADPAAFHSDWVVQRTVSAAAAKRWRRVREGDASFHPPNSVFKFRQGQSAIAAILCPYERTVNRRGWMRSRVTLLVAIVGAILGCAALLLQLMLTLSTIVAHGGTVLDGLWRYFGYFTVIANIFASFVLGR